MDWEQSRDLSHVVSHILVVDELDALRLFSSKVLYVSEEDTEEQAKSNHEFHDVRDEFDEADLLLLTSIFCEHVKSVGSVSEELDVGDEIGDGVHDLLA